MCTRLLPRVALLSYVELFSSVLVVFNIVEFPVYITIDVSSVVIVVSVYSCVHYSKVVSNIASHSCPILS